jgi:AcrR family transcriptional regulator
MTTEPESGTRYRLIAAAKLLLAKDGLAVRVADIVEQAKANIGAINYHFGNKDKLLQMVLEAACTQVVDARLRLLDAVTAGGRTATVQEIVSAWITPALAQVTEGEHEGAFLGQLTKIVSAASTDEHIGAPSARKLQDCNKIFIDALGRARPDLTPASLEWRLSGMIGTLVYVSESQVLSSGNGAVALEHAKAEILAFLVAGFEAPSPRL